MSNIMEQNRLISHVFSPERLYNTIQKITERIKRQGNKPYATIMHQLELLTSHSAVTP